jgi:hypothetical protein
MLSIYCEYTVFPGLGVPWACCGKLQYGCPKFISLELGNPWNIAVKNMAHESIR